MPYNSGSDKEVHNRLKSMNTAADVEEFIENEDLSWEPLDGNDANVGVVRSGSNPAQALAERLTNGIDAVIERAVVQQGVDPVPPTPRDAVIECFGGSEIGFNHQDQSWVRELAQNNLSVRIREGLDKNHPVIEVEDEGVGQPPSEFPETFLSLNENSKITKPYLIGKYGQGGSNTFDFCEYAIIISRHMDGGDIGWSIVRFNNRLDEEETYSDGVFEYCTLPDGSIPTIDEEHADDWTGSHIRLIEYDASSFNNSLTPSRGSLYTVSNEAMFGSIFPFYLQDHRTERFSSYPDSGRSRTIVGSRYRLNKPADDVFEAREFKRIEIEDLGTLRLKYWVLEDTDAVSQFVDKTEPIVFTLHGQKHHSEPKRIFKRTNHTFLKDRIIIEIDCEKLSQKGKRIFSSTRDRASEGIEYRKIKERVIQSLKDDEKLEELDEKFKQDALSESSSEQEERAKDLLADLLQQPDPSEVGDAVADGSGDGGGGGGGSGGRSSRDPVSPLHDEPTFIEIDNASDPIEAKRGRTLRIRVKVDAVQEFDVLDEGEIRIEINDLDQPVEYRNETTLEDGWKTFQFEVGEDSDVGENGQIKAVVEWEEGYLDDTRDVIIIEPSKTNTGGQASELDAPDIIQVNEDDEVKRSSLGWGDRDDAVVDYHPGDEDAGEMFVAMFNEGIQPIRETNDTEGTVEQYDQQYAAYISYFEMMRHQEMEEQDSDPPEEYVNNEKNRAAKMLIRSISEGMSPEELGIV